ncbi:late expression factor 2 [Lymantria dispar multiple nucleopolyhedrovirus]|uniref:Late expression factor 2 n=2 Tax=Lymantria dispar multicapsid nuclear polyhedrosis virus TaxID=10449 RepID=LEF2_NPVLD|nr:late expression factor 2 [Lymantria dispar multiple nucleopolyhedrovirus]P36869.2 RecName: Full=Late expression factor 2 [Lymantria dispar multiple nucleopolyhedrovirus]AAC70323.1 late expression factor 2 [Lymantria dispar multiple nucleopolyhedrovirus]AMO27992.1 LEF-2 [Lymantria dispar multiple nucleopolyhedrovirus]AMO65621.1 lef-2 [Lymantria dispar multiple nucleopolyhedrovirus]BAA07166.1 lef-2 homolog [Lymantria dispar multiple nucleopolyhedrovirus]
MTSSSCPRASLNYRPAMKASDVDPDAEYAVPLEHFDVEVSPYTVFERGGTCVRVSGRRLACLLRNGSRGESAPAPAAAAASAGQPGRKRSCKNVCFKGATSRRELERTLTARVNLPPCMTGLLRQFEIRNRGDRYRKRFVFNCYLINTTTCTACDRRCFVNAAAVLYERDEKCVREMMSLLRREDCYKPPNCSKMSQESLCFKSGACRGTNPLCNF